mmetsp:Transcript_31939/g.42292  ORF Transcript_31939/g.42292 Transcript_31939/m.42292 type:complete len:91 (+) Transcript_31939:807-1079(+)
MYFCVEPEDSNSHGSILRESNNQNAATGSKHRQYDSRLLIDSIDQKLIKMDEAESEDNESTDSTSIRLDSSSDSSRRAKQSSKSTKLHVL